METFAGHSDRNMWQNNSPVNDKTVIPKTLKDFTVTFRFLGLIALCLLVTLNVKSNQNDPQEFLADNMDNLP